MLHKRWPMIGFHIERETSEMHTVNFDTSCWSIQKYTLIYNRKGFKCDVKKRILTVQDWYSLLHHFIYIYIYIYQVRFIHVAHFFFLHLFVVPILFSYDFMLINYYSCSFSCDENPWNLLLLYVKSGYYLWDGFDGLKCMNTNRKYGYIRKNYMSLSLRKEGPLHKGNM